MKPLPSGKTAVDVTADLLSYLLKCAKSYIIETHPNGESLWTSVGDRIDIVLSHPNGWEGKQQSQMRRAAVMGGLVPDTPAGHARVNFVTEGEASLHYCVDSGLADQFIKASNFSGICLPSCSSWLQDGATVMIVDAGGGTVDFSSYAFTSTNPIMVEEMTTTNCQSDVRPLQTKAAHSLYRRYS